MKMLIVDDDFSSRKVLQGILSIYSSCDMATDGLEAVKAVEAALEENSAYDYIFLDIMMPILDGIGALKIIRNLEDKYNRKSKIYMTTAIDDMAQLSLAVANGCDDVIKKPISREFLISKVFDESDK